MPARALIADTEMMWTCVCGHRAWHHYEHCMVCGKERPAPEPEPAADPSNAPQPEMPGFS